MFNTDPLSMSIIHDLRNPLTAICAGAEMLNHRQLSPEHVKRLGGNIHKAACRMRELLDDLVGTAQGEPVAAENCDLREILADVCEDAVVAADNQGVGILLNLPARTEMTLARACMQRVFSNLITNSLEAMPGVERSELPQGKPEIVCLSRLRTQAQESLLRSMADYSIRSSPRERRTAWDWVWRCRAGPSETTAAICGSNLQAALAS
jgi:signal transduction histidine kinase